MPGWADAEAVFARLASKLLDEGYRLGGVQQINVHRPDIDWDDPRGLRGVDDEKRVVLSGDSAYFSDRLDRAQDIAGMSKSDEAGLRRERLANGGRIDRAAHLREALVQQVSRGDIQFARELEAQPFGLVSFEDREVRDRHRTPPSTGVAPACLARDREVGNQPGAP